MTLYQDPLVSICTRLKRRNRGKVKDW
jgi:hypothetical protein